RLNKKIPGLLVVMALGVIASVVFSFEGSVRLISNIGETPSTLPPFAVPGLDGWSLLVSGAVACTVLSLVESSAVARALAAKSGQELDSSAEFSGQGVANVAAAFFGGYPTSGSLGRSALNLSSGAQSRLAGALSGVLMLVVIIAAGPVIGYTPIPVLAGLIIVVAVSLMDVPRIKRVLKSSTGDRLAFLVTVLGTWVFPLDTAIYIGVGISLVTFLRRARLLSVRELLPGEDGRLTEIDEKAPPPLRPRTAVRVYNIEGPLFFGAAGELKSALRKILNVKEAKVVILRMKRTQGLDVTTATALEDASVQMKSEGRHLLLVGVRTPEHGLLRKSGVLKQVGEENVFPSRPGWFVAMESAIRRAIELAGEDPDDSPFEKYLAG
ncbi:MAG: SulP family inorganic anion transporter, partial [Nitrospira sp.]|nr:SulP family inorganic anion transporter [Nitrospira sp.]